MESFPEIILNTNSRPRPRGATSRRSANGGAAQQQAVWLVALLAMACIAAGGFAFHELSKSTPKRRASRTAKAAQKAVATAKPRAKSSAAKKEPQKPTAANAITAEQFESVPRGALRFRVEDIFGSPLYSMHDCEEVERFGSNGEIFGSEFVNSFVLAYRVSDRPGRIAVFMFQGQSTNPTMVDKQLQSE